MADESWALPGEVPDHLDVAPGIELRRPTVADLDELVATVNDDLDHLRPWMPWAQEPVTHESQAEFLRTSSAEWAAGRDFVYSLVRTGRLVGGAGLHIRRGPGVVELGYWIRRADEGQGVVSAAVLALMRLAATYDEVESIVICCDEANERSAAVPRRLGFTLTAVEQRPALAAAETGWHQVWTLPAAQVRSL